MPAPVLREYISLVVGPGEDIIREEGQQLATFFLDRFSTSSQATGVARVGHGIAPKP